MVVDLISLDLLMELTCSGFDLHLRRFCRLHVRVVTKHSLGPAVDHHGSELCHLRNHCRLFPKLQSTKLLRDVEIMKIVSSSRASFVTSTELHSLHWRIAAQTGKQDAGA